MADGNYAEALQKEGRNLTRLAVDKQITLPAHREQAVASVLNAIKRKRSVLLVGDVGVGKTAILHGVAAELAKMQRELWEISASAVMSGTRYLGDYQTKLDHILQGLKKKRGLLYFTDVWNLLTVGTSANDPSSLFDHVRPKVQAGELQLIGEVTPERFQRDRSRQNRLVAAGWTVLRFTWRDLVERPGYVVRTIRDVIG